jgi:hypothetical protein
MHFICNSNRRRDIRAQSKKITDWDGGIVDFARCHFQTRTQRPNESRRMTMKKSLILAAALSALAFSTAGASNAAPAVGHLGGLNAAAGSELQQVHYRPYKHYHNRKWHNRRWHKRQRHCFFRIGKRVCVWR